MTVIDYSTTEPSDAQLDEYIEVVGFAISKGTANVSAADKKKLRGLLRYYAKKKHPFTACVRDNRKRFGSRTEEYCAVLKDLIVGNTKWRGKGKKYTPKNLSEHFEDFNLFLTEELEFENDIPEDFLDYISSLTEEDIATMTNTNFATGDIVWKPERSFDYIRRELQEVLNESYSTMHAGEQVSGYDYWVEDIQDGQALICHKSNDYYIISFSITDNGLIVADEEDWIPVEKAWVETNLSESPQLLAEMFFDGGGTTVEDNTIWKTIMREGTWKLSPGPGGKPVEKPIKVVADGKSDARSMTISLQELKDNFEAEAKDHVTIPTSHDNKVLENTGFIRNLRIGKDEDGRAILEAAHEFTEPDVKEKALRGTIPNVSAGVLFDYLKKDTGKKFNAILDHVALTPSPWLNGMKPFGAVNAGENLEIISFSEENETGDMSSTDDTATNKGGAIVSTQVEEPEVKNAFFDEIGLSENEVRERLNRLDAVEAENRKNKIEAKCDAWQKDGKSPAVIKEAKAALLSDSGTVAFNFSEDGKTVELSLSDVVERLVTASPSLDLTEEPLSEEALAGEKPAADAKDENIAAEFSTDEKATIVSLMFEEGLSEEAAIAQVRDARESK